jgi:ribose transport system ATP-binding protein
MADILVEMEGIEKSFLGVHALSQCQFELRPGEVHALVGENGAGKSMLLKILAGVSAKDSGHILCKGRVVEIPNPRAAQNLGISMIHQELNLMTHLAVGQNMFIRREPC